MYMHRPFPAARRLEGNPYMREWPPSMSEELEVLKIVADRLRGASIAYMVTGSVAMNHYAVPRMTRDIDLVVELSSADVDRVCRLFEADFDVDRQAVHRAVEAP